MRILLVNQTFYPDVAATAVHASDLARELARQGHEVSVLAARRAYGRAEIVFGRDEIWEGVHIQRVPTIDFGKRSLWRRVLNFSSFLIASALRLVLLPRFDAVLAMTSPPLISCLAAIFTRIRGGELQLWVMDLNPDEAIAAGWLRKSSLAARWLEWLHSYSLRSAHKIIVLDRFMKERVICKLHASEHSWPTTVNSSDKYSVAIVPPGARDHVIEYDLSGRRAFREQFGLIDKFVVMYSGNHSPCHPLDTLLHVAEKFNSKPGETSHICFCFVGGGSEFQLVKTFAEERKLSNLVALPYQSEEQLSASLSAADLQTVVMGDSFVGIVHPSKIYNALALGLPILYIGPPLSHITEIVPPEAAGTWFFQARHGQVDSVVDQILVAKRLARIGHPSELAVAARYRNRLVTAELASYIVQ